MWQVVSELPQVEVDPILPVEWGRCEANVDYHISVFGGSKVKGCYVLKHTTLELYQLISHYVWEIEGNIKDVTLFKDERGVNNFIPIQIDSPNMFVRSLANVDKYNQQEAEPMYYVYMYIDPETNQPFYVGKGTQDRAYIHLQLCKQPKPKSNKRFYNKLNSLEAKGLQPQIIFVGQNIVEESIAYDLERATIRQYGRKGYDPEGILLNICEDARPPNHKGQTYQQIYGENWQEQVEKRRAIQLARGGYGPQKHSEETKRKISVSGSGANNHMFGKTHSTETRQKISAANKGRRSNRRKRYVLDNLSGESYVLEGFNEITAKCKELHIDKSTLQNQIYKNWPRAKSGKTKGWLLQSVDK